MFSSDIQPNSSPSWDVRLQNPSNFECDISRSLQIISNGYHQVKISPRVPSPHTHPYSGHFFITIFQIFCKRTYIQTHTHKCKAERGLIMCRKIGITLLKIKCDLLLGIPSVGRMHYVFGRGFFFLFFFFFFFFFFFSFSSAVARLPPNLVWRWQTSLHDFHFWNRTSLGCYPCLQRFSS